MEVLGDDDPDHGLTRGDRREVEKPLAELDLGSTGAGGIPAVDEPQAGPGMLHRAWAAATAGEALAVCGLALALVILFGGSGGPMAVLTLSYANYGPRRQLHEYATVLAVGAGIALLVSLASLYRMKPEAPLWARSFAGAAITLAVLLGLLTAVTLWRASSAPTTYGSLAPLGLG